jgi:hypothetical protein
MLEALQLVTAAAVPLKLTVPAVPKFAPAMVTEAPTKPEVGVKLAMLGATAGTVNLTPLLARSSTVTTTFPVVAPAGTGATMPVSVQLLTIVVVPLNLTVLAACVEPKFVPVIVTSVPIGPLAGFRVVILGRLLWAAAPFVGRRTAPSKKSTTRDWQTTLRDGDARGLARRLNMKGAPSDGPSYSVLIAGSISGRTQLFGNCVSIFGDVHKGTLLY